VDFQNGKTILGVMEGDTLHRAREGLQDGSLISLWRFEHLVHGA
jgi:hypothetical protein